MDKRKEQNCENRGVIILRKFILENNLKLIIEDEVLNVIYKFNPINNKYFNNKFKRQKRKVLFYQK